METYNELHRTKIQIEKIVGKSVSFDRVLKILLVARPLEAILTEMILA